jgi:hypothetical protein
VQRLTSKAPAFDLQADEAFGEVGAGGLVYFLAVDEDRDRVAVADRGERVPLAGRLLGIGLLAETVAADLAGLLVLEFGAAGERGSVPEVEVALVLVHALALDALRPDRVGGRHVYHHAGVAGLGEAPFDREAILLVDSARCAGSRSACRRRRGCRP